jgi:hypothetical protein
VKSQIPAQRIFQDVAAGLVGEASFQGGWSTAALGLALHFLIAITTAAVYYLVALRWPLLWGQPLLSGTIYGPAGVRMDILRSGHTRSPLRRTSKDACN